MESISDTLSKIPEMIKSFISNVVDFVKNLVKSIFSKIDGVKSRIEKLKESLNQSKDSYVDGGTFKNEHISKRLHTRKDEAYSSVPQAISMTWNAYMSAFGAAAHFVNVDFGKNLNGSFEEIIKDKMAGEEGKLNKLGFALFEMLNRVCTEKINDSVHEIAKAPNEDTVVYAYPHVLAGGLMMHCFAPGNKNGIHSTKFFMVSYDPDADLSGLEWPRLPMHFLKAIIQTAEDYFENYNRAKNDSVQFIKKLEDAGNQAIQLIDKMNTGNSETDQMTTKQANEFFDLVRVTATVVSKMLSVSLTESYKVVTAGLDDIDACLNSQANSQAA